MWFLALAVEKANSELVPDANHLVQKEIVPCIHSEQTKKLMVCIRTLALASPELLTGSHQTSCCSVLLQMN
jgi:hypothetical protein